MAVRVKNVIYKHVVVLREYERGWGSKDVIAVAYNSAEEALKAVEEGNAQNTSTTVPDYYIIARYEADMPEYMFDSINR